MVSDASRNWRSGITARRQRGAILLVALVFMFIMSLMGVQLSKRSVLDQRMATNQAVRTIAFERAESGLAYAESLVPALSTELDTDTGVYDCFALSAGYYAATGVGTECSTANLSLSSMDWNDNDSIAHPGVSGSRYAIEYLGIDEIKEIGDDVEIGSGVKATTTVHVYRVVSRGMEAGGAESILQSLVMVIKS